MEAQPVITTLKQKDPKRVEMGKRLAEMSKAARERKKRLAEAPADERESWNINYDRLIGLAGIVIAVVSICYSCAAPKKKPVIWNAPAVKVEPKGDFIAL